MAFLVSEIGGVFCVYAILSCFLSATLSSNSHFSAGLSGLHGFVLISICQKATYFFSAQENNSIGEKKNHSIAIVYLHYIYHQCTAVVSQETSNAEPVLRKYES